MQETRQRILEIVKMHGQATVDDLSTELGLTAVTIRHHLEVLRSRGLIAPPKALRKGGPGRPQHVYRLAEEADGLFPKCYDRLAEAILYELEARLSVGEMADLVDRVAARMASEAEIPEDLDFSTRVKTTLEYMNEMGYLASLEVTEDGNYCVKIANCPYGRIAHRHPPTCEIGARMVAKMVGVDAEAVERKTEESGRCTYTFSTVKTVA